MDNVISWPAGYLPRYFGKHDVHGYRHGAHQHIARQRLRRTAGHKTLIKHPYQELAYQPHYHSTNALQSLYGKSLSKHKADVKRMMLVAIDSAAPPYQAPYLCQCAKWLNPRRERCASNLREASLESNDQSLRLPVRIIHHTLTLPGRLGEADDMSAPRKSAKRPRLGERTMLACIGCKEKKLKVCGPTCKSSICNLGSLVRSQRTAEKSTG